MTLNQLAILLETTSYFMVTLDLYGVERLQKLEISLLEKLSNTEDLVRSVLKHAPRTIAITITIIYFGWLIIDVGMNGDYSQFTLKLAIETLIRIALVVFLFSAMVSYFKIFAYILLIPIYLLRFLVKILLFLIQKLSLEGTLLFLGTMFFLMSKIISYNS